MTILNIITNIPTHTWLFIASVFFAMLTALAILFGTTTTITIGDRGVHVIPAWHYTISFAFLTALWALYVFFITI